MDTTPNNLKEVRDALKNNGSTSADAVITLQMAVREEHDDAADMNRDGMVTSVDALMILQAARESNQKCYIPI